jgi:hypothetical protein
VSAGDELAGNDITRTADDITWTTVNDIGRSAVDTANGFTDDAWSSDEPVVSRHAEHDDTERADAEHSYAKHAAAEHRYAPGRDTRRTLDARSSHERTASVSAWNAARHDAPAITLTR